MLYFYMHFVIYSVKLYILSNAKSIFKNHRLHFSLRWVLCIIGSWPRKSTSTKGMRSFSVGQKQSLLFYKNNSNYYCNSSFLLTLCRLLTSAGHATRSGYNVLLITSRQEVPVFAPRMCTDVCVSNKFSISTHFCCQNVCRTVGLKHVETDRDLNTASYKYKIDSNRAS